MRYYLSLTFLFLLITPVTKLYAHSVNGQVLKTSQAVTLQYLYSTGDPAPYANIKVYSPENTNIEYQNARTDKLGNFSFLPNTEGSWTVIMSDNMGHKTETLVNVQNKQTFQSIDTNDAAISVDSTQPFMYIPLWIRGIFGISILFNIFIGIYILLKKQKQRLTHAH